MNSKFLLGLIELIIDLLRGIGVITLITPLVVYNFIHGDSDRYIWILSGPEPFSNLGGGPYQMFIYISLVVVGLIFFAVTSIAKRRIFRYKLDL